MNDRKQHVIKSAHKLFVEKGFQATSIQDILEYSCISKGTFYNYFSSKNELLIALIKSIRKKLEIGLNELQIGHERSDIEVFTKQIELHLKANRTNKLLSLYDEVMFSNDPELKRYLKENHLQNLRWLYHRFIDIFGEERKPYLLDCSLMFMGILQQSLKFNSLANSSISIHEIVRFSVDRIVKIVDEVSLSNDRLLDPFFLEKLFPKDKGTDQVLCIKLHKMISAIKKNYRLQEQDKTYELLNFIEEEIVNAKAPRVFVIESAIGTLKSEGTINMDHITELEQLAKAVLKTK
ncbi:TetR/AcrR family transcriptional regulator [Bacillus sp. EB01]|uniref:TetR/AcrR family transcriptional regulator n=1 Tax=Bacillus sp. EB01 TaxID=1347086 RepID=UPI0005C654F5|nr:TetR/AcrR family transcriptional regulator [Bacillus sp. EB01]